MASISDLFVVYIQRSVKTYQNVHEEQHIEYHIEHLVDPFFCKIQLDSSFERYQNAIDEGQQNDEQLPVWNPTSFVAEQNPLMKGHRLSHLFPESDRLELDNVFGAVALYNITIDLSISSRLLHDGYLYLPFNEFNKLIKIDHDYNKY